MAKDEIRRYQVNLPCATKFFSILVETGPVDYAPPPFQIKGAMDPEYQDDEESASQQQT